MSAITSKVQICNMSNGHLGNKNTVNDIDTPKTDKELVYALWYDITRQNHLKKLMPNFALDRVIVSQVTAPAFGYAYAYEYPNTCLKVLGIGDVQEKGDVPFTVEGNKILTDVLYSGGLPLRIIRDIDDVSKMSSEFIMSFSIELADRVALSITQDGGKKKAIASQKAEENANTTGLNAQENPPIRRSVSRFRNSRYLAVGSQQSPSKK